ncbi:MAG: hypothetical protein IJX76_00030 [Clostridia bacterium]|nr:hypothetical protein [Clostridia bacterium]
MKTIKRGVWGLAVLLLSAGVLLTAASCKRSGSAESELPPLDLISPETLYEKMLEDDHYQIHALYDITTAESDQRSVDYSLTKDGATLKFRYKETTAADGEYQEITYADLEAERYIYRDILFDWVYDAPSEEYDNGDLEGYLYNILPMDPEFMLEDRNFMDLAEGGTVYEIDKEAFLEFMDEEEYPDLPVTLTLQVDGQSYLITTAYELSGGEAVDSTVRVTFEDIAVELPEAKLSINYEDWDDLPSSICYTGSYLEAVLEGKRNITEAGLIDADSVRCDGINTYESEGPEHLFDGVDTAEEWYYNADGSLKANASPGSCEGGGPGKCCGATENSPAYFFFSSTEQVTVASYVLTTANDATLYENRTPIYWALFGSNDEAAADCTDFYDADWVTLDAVYDDSLYYSDNFQKNGFDIDTDRQGAYRYYCLIAYSGSDQIQIGELELYSTN